MNKTIILNSQLYQHHMKKLGYDKSIIRIIEEYSQKSIMLLSFQYILAKMKEIVCFGIISGNNFVLEYVFISIYNNKNTMIQLQLQHSHQHEHNHQTDHKHEQTDPEQESNLSQIPCHPHRPVAAFDFSAIEEQIKLIRRRKEEARLAAQMAKKAKKNPHEIYEADVIEDAFEQSEDLIPLHVRLALKQRIKFIEDKVYLSSQNESYGGFVSRIKQQVLNNQALANELNLAMTEVQMTLQGQILQGVYQIHNVQHKPKFAPPQPEPAHRVKLKNMLIKSKIMDLKQEFNKSEVASESIIQSSRISSGVQKKQGQIWGDGFHLLSQGTKKAKQFIKKIQRQQKELRDNKSNKINQLKSLEVKSAMEHKEFEQQMRKERHQALKQRYQQGRSQKKAQKQKQQQKEKQYAQFLKQYRGRKPLFRVKEQQYLHNIVEQQQKRRKLKLEQIHEAKKPMSHEEIIEHQKNYQKWKQQKQEQLRHQREMRKKQEENLPRRSFYRGKFHSLIVEQKQQQKKKVDPQTIRDALLQKQKQFAEFIRKKYAPLISQNKKKQLQEMMKGLQKGRNDKALSQEAYKQLGNQYLKELHKMIAQLKAKGLIKKNQKEEVKPRIKNYLQQVRDKYNFSTVDYSSQVQSNTQWVHNRAIKLEKDARIKEKVMRYKDDEFDIDKHMRQLDEINQKYIHSAQAKMTLINKLQGKTQRSISVKPSDVTSQDQQ